MDASVKAIVDVVIAVGLVVLFGFANRTGFEAFISQPLVEPLSGAKTWLAWLKPAQPYFVVVASVAVALLGKIDLVSFLNGVAPVFQGDPTTYQLITGVAGAVAAIGLHYVLPSQSAPAAPKGG